MNTGNKWKEDLGFCISLDMDQFTQGPRWRNSAGAYKLVGFMTNLLEDMGNVQTLDKHNLANTNLRLTRHIDGYARSISVGSIRPVDCKSNGAGSPQLLDRNPARSGWVLTRCTEIVHGGYIKGEASRSPTDKPCLPPLQCRDLHL